MDHSKQPTRRSVRLQLRQDSAMAGPEQIRDLKSVIIALTDEASQTQLVLADNSREMAESSRRTQTLISEWKLQCDSLLQERDYWYRRATDFEAQKNGMKHRLVDLEGRPIAEPHSLRNRNRQDPQLDENQNIAAGRKH